MIFLYIAHVKQILNEKMFPFFNNFIFAVSFFVQIVKPIAGMEGTKKTPAR